MGEGGAVNIVHDQKLKVISESFRDWGRIAGAPVGLITHVLRGLSGSLESYPLDHKYTYSHLGYNLKPLDPQAAIGRVQLKRLPEFIEIRKQNKHSV